jgi:hypothetical protein
MSGETHDKKGKVDTTWRAPHAGWNVSPRGLKWSLLDFGPGHDEHRPAVLVVQYAASCKIRPHYHGCDYISVMVEGSMTVGGKAHEVGSIRIVKAGTGYGPLVAGPDGCTVLDIFADRTGVMESNLAEYDPGLNAEERQEAIARTKKLLGLSD